MNTVNLQEILIVNSLGILLMAFLQYVRLKNIKDKKLGEPLFDAMIWSTVTCCAFEMISFLVDGKMFTGAMFLSYLSNSICYIGTTMVGFLWAVFTELRIFRSTQRVRRKAKYLLIPLVIEVVLVFINLAGTGVLFTISAENVYQRGTFVEYSYVALFFYYIYSLMMVDRSKKSGFVSYRYPTLMFILPCMVGTVIQGMCYGITVGWTGVAVAMLFVHIQLQSLDIMTDPLSGLYNRKHLELAFESIMKSGKKKNIYGIMLDVNGFKAINDTYGHSEGDNAIRHIGRILSDSISDSGIVTRFAGDEFVILMNTDSEDEVLKTMSDIETNVELFNRSGKAPYEISFAMGYQVIHMDDGMADFIASLDEEMYHAKKTYYETAGMDRRKN